MAACNKMFRRLMIGLVFIIIFANRVSAYSVLTHQAIIDLTWKSDIEPLILKRFPNLSEKELLAAQSYAYGGCIIQDMGYYPFSNPFFSDLLHYVRSGDFVEALIAESQNADEYAFALGALSHYVSDNTGHSKGTNLAVPIYYPKLRRKYGDAVSYEKSPAAHINAEFGFDVLQVSRGHYASEDYHDFIGFNVSKSVLDRALRKTYGLGTGDFFINESLAFNTYRRTVSKTIPYMTKVAWELKRDEIKTLDAAANRRDFVYAYSRLRFESEFGKQYRKTSVLQKFLAGLFKILPKIGALKALQFKPPTQETEKLYIESLNQTLIEFKNALSKTDQGQLNLLNTDCDTGRPAKEGESGSTDKTYGKLLERLEKTGFKSMPSELKDDILGFFSNLNESAALKKDEKRYRKVMRSLDRLKTTAK